MTKTWKPGLVALHQSTKNASMILRAPCGRRAWVSVFFRWDVNEGYLEGEWGVTQREGSEWRGAPLWVGSVEHYEEMRAACETPADLAEMARKAAAITPEPGKFYRRANGEGVYMAGSDWCDLSEGGLGWSTKGPWPALVEEVVGLKSWTSYPPKLRAIWAAHHEEQEIADVRDAAIALLEQRLAQAERECANKDLIIDRQRAALDVAERDCTRLMSRVRDQAGVIDEQRTELTYVRDCTSANEDKLTALAADNALKDREIHRLKEAYVHNRAISSIRAARKGERYMDIDTEVWSCPTDTKLVCLRPEGEDGPVHTWAVGDRFGDPVEKWGPFKIV